MGRCKREFQTTAFLWERSEGCFSREATGVAMDGEREEEKEEEESREEMGWEEEGI